MVAVLVPSRIALREHAERDPREREDVSGVVVRWMDQVDERESRRMPHSDRAVAFSGGISVYASKVKQERAGDGPDALISQSRSGTSWRASTAPSWPVKRDRSDNVARSQTWQPRGVSSQPSETSFPP